MILLTFLCTVLIVKSFTSCTVMIWIKTFFFKQLICFFLLFFGILKYCDLEFITWKPLSRIQHFSKWLKLNRELYCLKDSLIHYFVRSEHHTFLHIKWVRAKSQISHTSHIFPLSLSLQGCAEYTNALGNNNNVEKGAGIRRGLYIQYILTNLVYLNNRAGQMTQRINGGL